MFLQVCVILFTGGRSTWPGTPLDQVHHPGDQVHPPGPGTPRDQVHRYPPQDQVVLKTTGHIFKHRITLNLKINCFIVPKTIEDHMQIAEPVPLGGHLSFRTYNIWWHAPCLPINVILP